MFRLQKYKPQLLDFLSTHPEWIQPFNFHKEILNIIEDSTMDLSVSRPLARVPWAIATDGMYIDYCDEISWNWFLMVLLNRRSEWYLCVD